MTASVSDHVIVLRTRPLREADLLVTLLTQRAGKLVAVAGHARRSRKRFGGALAAGTCGATTWQALQGTALVRLNELAPEWTPPLTPRSMAHFAAFGMLLHVVDAMTADGQVDADKFFLLTNTLPRLVTAPNVAAQFSHWLLAWLRCCGYAPTLDRCVQCSRAIAADATARFVPHDGGLRCAHCPPPRVWSLDIPAGAAPENFVPLHRVGLSQYVAHLTGKPLLSGPYWDMLWNAVPAHDTHHPPAPSSLAAASPLVARPA